MNVLDRKPEVQDIEKLLGLNKPRRRSMPWAWILLLLGLAAGTYGYFGGRGEKPVAYATEAAAVGNLTVTVTATGTVQPTNQVDVSSELSGIVRTVFVDYNGTVKAGQVIAELDTITLAAQVERSRASLAAARARVAQAEATLAEKGKIFERAKTLNERQWSSENTLDLAKAEFDRSSAGLESAKADVRVSEAELKQNETNLAKTKIYSPVNGVVLKRNVEPGQTVAASFQAPVLFTLAEDLRQVELQVDVDEADIGQVREGLPASFTVEAYQDRKFPAAIEQVRFASETVNGVVTYKAVLSAKNEDLALRPGMTATAEIVTETVRDAVLIPNAALRFTPPEPPKPKRGGSGFSIFRFPRGQQKAVAVEQKGNKRRIYSLENGQPVPVDIAIGSTDGINVQVLEGLSAGMSVITGVEEPVTGR